MQAIREAVELKVQPCGCDEGSHNSPVEGSSPSQADAYGAAMGDMATFMFSVCG